MVFALTLQSIWIVRNEKKNAFSVRWKLDFINDLTQEGNLKVWLLIQEWLSYCT